MSKSMTADLDSAIAYAKIAIEFERGLNDNPFRGLDYASDDYYQTRVDQANDVLARVRLEFLAKYDFTPRP